jgi:two-component system CheB/CheR fusion protein
VGIGASAGGLAALERFFEHVPPDTGAAYVVIQHSDPERPSAVAGILAQHTPMPCAEVAAGTRLEPDHVYVLPPNTAAGLEGGRVQLATPLPRGRRTLPIDAFFGALGRALGERAVGVILSGSGGDGAAGLREINENGGLVLAQAPETADFDGMPRAAIDTGLVDIVVPVEDMPPRIAGFLSLDAGEDAEGEAAGRLPAILALLRLQRGHDFRTYKPGTIRRRVARRMGFLQIDSLADYLARLRRDAEEVDALFRDLLVGVTGFFRDPEAFEALERTVIRPLVAEKAESEPVRVWVPGCSTGEEAYSIAMLVLEALEAAGKQCPVQVFATDLDETALATGRAGVYPESVAAAVPPARLARFFERTDHACRVTDRLRETVTFAMQDVVGDPPFSRVDLISCRNLLIYLNTGVQRTVLGYFHFALAPGGHLFLGTSESAGAGETLFAPVDKHWRIYRRAEREAAERRAAFPVQPARPPRRPRLVSQIEEAAAEQGRLKEIVQGELLRRYAPAAVLTDERFEVLYFQGATGRFLTQPGGVPTHDLAALVAPEMRASLRIALNRAALAPEAAASERIRLDEEDRRREVELAVHRIGQGGRRGALFLVTFAEREPDGPASMETHPPGAADESMIGALEAELQATREELQSHVEELEAANEELQAANEEVMSVNEELQSTNEELETSKEELQATNEELTTLNAELDEKVRALSALNDDLANLVASTGIATLFLDTEARIIRFTPATKRLMNLIATDVGRPLGDIRFKFSDDRLDTDIERVLETLQPAEREIATEEGEWYLRRVLPYRTADNRIAGAVVTFFEITARVRSERKMRASEERFRELVRGAPDPLIIADETGAVALANRAACALFGRGAEAMQGMRVDALVPERHRRACLACFARVLERDQPCTMGEPDDLVALRADGGEVAVEATLGPITAGAERLVSISIRDVSERRRAAEATRAARQAKEDALAAKSRFLTTASHDLRQPLQSLAMTNEALLRTVDDPEARRLLGMQQRGLEGMRSLLHALLDLSRLEAGAVEPEMRDVALRPLLDRIREELAPEAERKGLALEVDCGKVAVRADAALLGQILRNLAGNAIRYTESGSVRMAAEQHGREVRLAVSDTGIGIAAAEIPHIFEEFYSVQRGPAMRNGTLGLGLSIVKQLAGLLGSEVSVESAPGAGSCFSLVLPAGTGAAGAGAPEDGPEAPGPPPVARVLIVEDDEAVLEATMALLSVEPGLEPLPALSAEAALARADALPPDLVLTDLRLGEGESGIAVIESVRARAGRRVPAILLTGDTAQDPAAGLADVTVLIKPVDPATLAARIRERIAL